MPINASYTSYTSPRGTGGTMAVMVATEGELIWWFLKGAGFYLV